MATSEQSDHAPSPRWARRRRRLLVLTTIAAVLLVPWIFVLSGSLPSQHKVHQWDTAWVGFDILLLVAFASSAVSIWRRSLATIPLLSATAVLLLVDAWFDVTLSWGTKSHGTSLITAFLIELPMFVVLVLSVRMMLRRLGSRISPAASAPPDTDPPTSNL